MTARARAVAVTALLAAATVAWAALPVPAGVPVTVPVLAATVLCAAASVFRLALGETEAGEGLVDPVLVRMGAGVVRAVRSVPWAEVLVVAALTLEALHRARPWHTAMLGVLVLGYLFAMHLSETEAGLAVLRPCLPYLAAGLGLLALAVGVGMLSPLAAGAASGLLRVLAVVAAVVAGGLVLPLRGK